MVSTGVAAVGFVLAVQALIGVGLGGLSGLLAELADIGGPSCHVQGVGGVCAPVLSMVCCSPVLVVAVGVAVSVGLISLGICPWPILLVLRVGTPGPGLDGRDELECIFGVPLVALVNFFEEDGAFPTPAGMALYIAQDTAFVLRLGAEIGPGLLCAVAARVCCRNTFVCIVVPPMTFEASYWFLPDLLNTDPAATNGESIGYRSVSSVHIIKREDEMGSLLSY